MTQLKASLESPPLSEPVRMVIWDLDDTLWQGTLAEGAVSLSPQTQELVKQLARRGIVSSICSKNDVGRVRDALTATGMWDFFVFPSINWEPKGPRIKALIEAVQLRSASVVFIDDNPSNREEALYYNKGLRVAGVEIIPRMLKLHEFEGKPDVELQRLHQYQTLQTRFADQQTAGRNVQDFLRHSQIRVRIEYQLEPHVDRIIELINRTNQLNFTQHRLSDDTAAARDELRAMLRSHEVQAGLLHVSDRYGDYGHVGFYAVRNGNELIQFCFSCRILGMGVETWTYRILGRPPLKMPADVVSNPVLDRISIDWINADNEQSRGGSDAGNPKKFDWVAARGGCDLQALSHYFRMASAEVVGEFNVGRGGFDARVDHSIFLRYAVAGLPDAAIEEAAKLGYRPEDFRTALTLPRAGRGLIVLSFWADAAYALYRHRRLAFCVPFSLPGRANHALDARHASLEELPPELRDGWMARALETLRTDYDYLGLIDRALFEDNMNTILNPLSHAADVILLGANTRLRDTEHGVTHTSSANAELNLRLKAASDRFGPVSVVDVRDAIVSEDEVADWSHFDRRVYFRLYETLCVRQG